MKSTLWQTNYSGNLKVTLVGIALAEESIRKVAQGLAVIHIARGKLDAQQLPW